MRAQWIIPVVVVVGTWIGMLWLIRPRWGYCADGGPADSFCDSGVYSLGAQLATVGLIVLLIAHVVLALTVRGGSRRIVLTISVVVLAVACLAALVMLFQVVEDIPMPIVD